MSGNPYPNSPNILKAALISMGATIPVPRLIMLQYDPAELTRQGSDPSSKRPATRRPGPACWQAPRPKASR